jgi:hypothetical protein
MELSRSFTCMTHVSFATTRLLLVAAFAVSQEQARARHVPRTEITGRQRAPAMRDLRCSVPSER